MTNYLNNSELLKEIHRSKMTYCAFTDWEYTKNILIVKSEDELKQLKKADLDLILEKYNQNIQQKFKAKKYTEKDYNDFITSPDNIIVRVMCNDHIPEQYRKNTSKIKFLSFKHYKWVGTTLLGNNKWKEVLRSHWKFNDKNSTNFDTEGHFEYDHGKLSNNLVNMLIMLAERYCRRPNLKGYSFVDEMIQESAAHLCISILKFNEMLSDNPFAYGSQIILNTCRQILNQEARQRKIRDDLLEEYGDLPSYTRQSADENDIKTAIDYYNSIRDKSSASDE